MPSVNQHLEYLKLPTVKAFLDTIAWAEGGKSYYTLYGGGSFTGNQHPNKAITAGAYTSTAAGRYQFLYKTWIGIKNKLGLQDFSPISQDIAALELVAERGQLTKIINGNLEGALKGLGCAWAALPFSTCNQRMRSWNETLNYYNAALKVYGGKTITANTVNQVIQNNQQTTGQNLPVINNPQETGFSKDELLIIGGAILILTLI
jgi:muramidase (phage lysozyme)